MSVTAAGDTVTFTFVSGTPPFQALTQSDAKFLEDPTGQPVTLAGTDGARIVLTGFRGDQSNYGGAKTFTSTGPLMLQVNELGDFEGSVTWGIGLSQPACATVVSSAWHRFSVLSANRS